VKQTSGQPGRYAEVRNKAMKQGSFDTLEIPLEPTTLKGVLEQAQENWERTTPPRDNEYPRTGRDSEEPRGWRSIVGASPRMRDVLDRVVAAAQTKSTVLITGESGTGKELVARAIHEESAPSRGPFVPVNCATLPREFADAELFGARSGDSPGLFAAAEGGTLLLDEVTELAMETQAKLLRVLQERAIRPVGSFRETPVNVRIIATTNRDPFQSIAQGKLREDLYYRLSVVRIQLPALRERLEDLRHLVQHIVRKLNVHHHRTVQGVDRNVQDKLLAHNWPGNVRELENVLESAVHFCKTDWIMSVDLPQATVRETQAPPPPAATVRRSSESGDVLSLKEAERVAILQALKHLNGNKSLVAKALGISRKQLYVKLACFGLGNSEDAD
jgi:DNA-binding NtrC family response regulator